MIKKLYNEQITKEFTSHVIAFSAAENGAMGNPGSVRFVTDEKEIYEINNGTIVMEIKEETNQKLYINKTTLKPEKIEIINKNNGNKVYILYNEIEINI